MGPCIFCFRGHPGVTFSKEHVIPDSLGGQLILYDYVCSECNSRFGREFDHQILKNPAIVAALEKLKLAHNRPQLINKNFRISGFSDEIEVRGKATDDGFEFPSQSIPDGSVIHPEGEYKEPLLKSILRDQSLYNAGMKTDQIMEEYERLVATYEKAAVGQKIEWPSLGRTLVKRSNAFKIKLEPKGSGDVSRLVAKIGYEFGFLTCYREFLSSECVAKPLHSFIMNGEKQPGFHIMRIGTELSDYVPIHFISFQVYDSVTRIVVGFFGSIAYALIAPAFEHKVLSEIAQRYDCSGVTGVEYQQDLEKDRAGFWAILPGNRVKYLGPKAFA
jgi:hypothetical protein